MKGSFLFFISLLLLLNQTVYSQANKKEKPNLKKVSENTELNFFNTNKRGIKNEDTIYYVEKDKQTITTYVNNKIKWRANIIKILGKPTIGEPTIRYVKYDKDALQLVYGKHNYASINVHTGIVRDEGSD